MHSLGIKCFVGLLLIGTALAACSDHRRALGRTAEKEMLGLTKRDILSCMGAAHRRASRRGSQLWVYHLTDQDQRCTVNVVFVGHRVRGVNYVGFDSTYPKHHKLCAAATKSCLTPTH